MTRKDIANELRARKARVWSELAERFSRSNRSLPALNLGELDKKAGDVSIVVVPGKVLGEGEYTKKAKVSALSFSKLALEKLAGKTIPVSELASMKISPKDIQIVE